MNLTLYTENWNVRPDDNFSRPIPFLPLNLSQKSQSEFDGLTTALESNWLSEIVCICTRKMLNFYEILGDIVMTRK